MQKPGKLAVDPTPFNRRAAAFAALVVQRLRCPTEGLLRFSIAALFSVKTVHLRR